MEPILDLLNQDIIKQCFNQEIDNETLLKVLLTVFEYAPNVFFVKDKKGRYVIVNKEFEKFVRLPMDKIIGKTDYDIMNEFDAKDCVASDQPALEDPGKIHVSFEVERSSSGDIASYLSVNKQVTTTSVGELLIGIVTKVAA